MPKKRKKRRAIYAGSLAEALRNPKATVYLALHEEDDVGEFGSACLELSGLRELEIIHPDLARHGNR